MKKVIAKNSKKQVRVGKTARKEGLLPPPVGTSDWATFSRDSYCVDKTLILKDLIDSKSRVVLFTRPRRFGKTTMLEMLRAFYEGEASLFRDKKIWAAGVKYRKEQGGHPVIFLSFKDIKQTTVEEAFARLAAVIGDEVARFADCIENGWGNGAKKRSLRKVINREGTKDELSESLGLLSEAVHAFTKKLPVILIDEYDQPITAASTNGFYGQAAGDQGLVRRLRFRRNGNLQSVERAAVFPVHLQARRLLARHARIHHRDARRLRRTRREARHPQVRHGLLQEESGRLQGHPPSPCQKYGGVIEIAKD